MCSPQSLFSAIIKNPIGKSLSPRNQGNANFLVSLNCSWLHHVTGLFMYSIEKGPKTPICSLTKGYVTTSWSVCWSPGDLSAMSNFIKKGNLFSKKLFPAFSLNAKLSELHKYYTVITGIEPLISNRFHAMMLTCKKKPHSQDSDWHT